MAKKFLVAILIPFLLSSCISITKYPDVSVPRQDFITATLAPTAIRWMLGTATISPATQIPDPARMIPPSANCTKAAILLRDVTVPDNTNVQAGETFTKTWEFQNTGTCSWTNYTMQFSSGESMNAPLSAPVMDTTPGGKVQVSVDLSAPSMEGSYTAVFTLNDPSGNAISIGVEKSFWVKVVVGNPVAIQTLPASIMGGSTNCAYSENAGYVSELISLINQARAEAGLAALNVDAQLTQAAQSHSMDMACSNILSHVGSDGSRWWERISRTGYFSTHGPSVAEILAIGTPQDAMNQWRSDPGHWEFVMTAGTEIGVGYAYSSQSDYGGYFTVDLGD
jgi:uncharacterized protein YkwD